MKKLNVHLEFSFGTEPDSGRLPLRNSLIDMLDAVKSSGSLSGAAKLLKFSYRHLWNELNRWEKELGAELLVRGRGKNGELTEYAERLLWANKEIQARYLEQILDLKAGISQTFSRALKDNWDPIRIDGCADTALDKLRRIPHPNTFELEVSFSSSLAGLKLLAEGKCDLAGFNFPKASARGGSAAKLFLPLLDEEKNRLIFFASRLQGIATAAGNPLKIYSVLDLQLKHARFMNRAVGTGTRLIFDEQLTACGVKPEEIDGYDNISASAPLTAVNIASGKVDAGICTEKIAEQHGLDFIPLVKESYFLAARLSFLQSKKGEAFVEYLKTISWDDLPGYDFSSCGEIMRVSDVFSST